MKQTSNINNSSVKPTNTTIAFLYFLFSRHNRDSDHSFLNIGLLINKATTRNVPGSRKSISVVSYAGDRDMY